MARSGMSTLITQLRGMTNAGTADYTLAGVTYWTDDQLETELDRRSERIAREALPPINVLDDESFEYRTRHYPTEGTASGTAYFVVMDANENVITNYTLDELTGRITFNSDTGGTVYYARYYAYDLERSAAEVWTQKAAHYSLETDFATDNHNIRASQKRTAALEMAQYWRSQSKPKVTRVPRHDEAYR